MVVVVWGEWVGVGGGGGVVCVCLWWCWLVVVVGGVGFGFGGGWGGGVSGGLRVAGWVCVVVSVVWVLGVCVWFVRLLGGWGCCVLSVFVVWGRWVGCGCYERWVGGLGCFGF